MKHLQYSALHGAILLSRNKPEYLKSIQKWLDDNNNKAKK